MIGVLNTTCLWCKQSSVNKYGEPTYNTPISIPCSIGKDTRLTQTDTGLIKTEEMYYILHSAGAEVQDGDTLNGNTVAISAVSDLSGNVCYYRAVVVDG